MKARQVRRWVMLLGACVALLLPGVAPLMAAEPAVDREQQRQSFRDGWSAARRGDQAGILRAIRDLGDYPLIPYLEFELLRQRIDRVPEPVMEQFLARHRGWSFETSLETAWLRSLGRNGDFEALVRHGQDSIDTEVRCHLARARVDRDEVDGLEDQIEQLWQVGKSQPKACDPAFGWWRRQGNPSPEAAWQRFQLALDAGSVDLARYLRRYLTSDQREWADQWLNMQIRPHVTLREARQWRDHEVARQLVSAGIRRQARSDWERADRNWRLLEPRFKWSERERGAIAREVALFRAVALDVGAVAAIDALPESARNQQILEWRARAAMAHGEWSVVLESIQAMSVTEQASSRWRYWRGRALAAMQRPEAMVAFASLSTEPNYYGFLASARLGQDLSLCHQELSVDPAVQRRLVNDAEFDRAMELYHVGLRLPARQTWAAVARRLSPAELEQAALHAASHGWYDRAIVALNAAGNRHAYPWRFPMAEKGRVLAESGRRNVNPALIYGLMRAESAMQPDALSPAGARGLLQLMPGTAREVASRHRLRFNGSGDLMDPAINIPLGIAHLAELQDRYDGNWVLVAAAYNAGVNAVARWLAERPRTEPDVWMETLPFYETRDYVPRILAFATIYEWQLDQQPSVVAAYALGDATPAGRFACPE